jgi:secreted trypsin-like serine protease
MFVSSIEQYSRQATSYLALRMIILAMGGVCFAPAGAAAQSATIPDVTITYDRSNRATLEAFGAAPIVKDSQEDLSETIRGTEESQCRPKDYGRRSSSTVSISTNVSTADPARLTAQFRISTIANGGHYRTCVAGCDPIGQNCLGIVGHDTKADGSGATNLQARVTFGPNILQDVYDLKLSSSLPRELGIKVTAPGGSPVTVDANGLAHLRVKPNDVYYVEAALAVSSSNEGGCCADNKSVAAQLDLQVLKPPILATNAKLEPYIVGGKQTEGYKNVVAILLRGQLHCSGTVVAQHTILTAAHCINGYEDQIKAGQMSFLLGTIITSPQFGPKLISDGTYPRGNDAIRYNPATYEHDIGLLYTAEVIPAPAAHLQHASSPPQWSSIINKQALDFVGFGYNKSSDGDLVGAGVKREGPWQANKADDWRFYFQSAGNNTCSGDSGGPAFFQNENTRDLVLVGITSVGDPNCSYGADTRMDAHYTWVAKLLK